MPQIVALGDDARHAAARRLDCVLTDRLCFERWEFTVPVDHLRVGVADGVYLAPVDLARKRRDAARR